MTQWQSMFAAGACNVAVSNDYGVLWTGALAFGQSSPAIPDGGTGKTFVVSVDANGVVTLSTPDGASPIDAQVNVIPQYDTSKLQTQVAGISGFDPFINAGFAKADDGTSISLAFDPVTGAATPSAVAFPARAAAPGSAFVGVQLSGGG